MNHFRQFSIVSPLVNLFIVPILPLIMILGILVSVLGIIYLPLSELFSFPLAFLMKYMSEIVSFFSSFKYAIVNTGQLSVAYIIIYYVILATIVIFFRKKEIVEN